MIRFLREGLDVECYPGENLREVALREGIELYGLKGKLGNCGGCGQCITCFVDVTELSDPTALSGRTKVEDSKLRNRPDTWRLACQVLVERSLYVITRPQARFADLKNVLIQASQQNLPAGPLSWPARDDHELNQETDPSATTDEAEAGLAEGR